MIQSFFIEGTLPGANEFLNAAKGPFGSREYTQLKKNTENLIAYYARKAKIKPVLKPVKIEIFWREKNKKRDIDNIQSCVKCLNDALRAMGILKNDTWACVTEIQHWVTCDPEFPGVMVRLIEEDECVSASPASQAV